MSGDTRSESPRHVAAICGEDIDAMEERVIAAVPSAETFLRLVRPSAVGRTPRKPAMTVTEFFYEADEPVITITDVYYDHDANAD